MLKIGGILFLMLKQELFLCFSFSATVAAEGLRVRSVHGAEPQCAALEAC